MNCENCQRLLLRDGFHRLSGEQKQEILNHIDGCSECAAFFQLENQLIALVEEEKRVQLAADVVDRVMALIVEGEQQPHAQRQGVSLSWSAILRAVAAVLLILLAVSAGVFMGNLSRKSLQAPQELTMLDDARLESFFVYSE